VAGMCMKCDWCSEDLCERDAMYAVRIPGTRTWLNLCEEHFEAYRDFRGPVQWQPLEGD